MVSKINITIFLLVVVCLFFGTTFQLNAKMYLKTQIATGKITDIRDGVIKLDWYREYCPAKKNMILDIKKGTEVTIRYFISMDDIRKYVEIAPGLNTLSVPDVPVNKKEKTGHGLNKQKF